MKANGIRTIVIRGVLLILLSLYFLIVFGQKSPNLVSFNVNAKENTFSLHWQLAKQNNLSTIVIERKEAGDDFRQVAEFWVNFEGNTETNFNYTDKAVKAKKAEYRLKLITAKGEVEYSELVSSSAVQRAIKKSGGIKTQKKQETDLYTVIDSKTDLKSVLLLKLQEREVNVL